MIDRWDVLILFSELNPLSTSAVLTLFVNINLTSSKIALMESGDVCGTSSFYFLVVPQKSVVSDNQTTTKSSPVAHMTYLSPNWGWFLPKCDIHVSSKIWVQKLLPVNKLTGVATGRRTNPATIKNRPDLFFKINICTWDVGFGIKLCQIVSKCDKSATLFSCLLVTSSILTILLHFVTQGTKVWVNEK